MPSIQPRLSTAPPPRYLIGVSSKTYFTHTKTISYLKSLVSAFPKPIPDLNLFFIPSYPSLVSCAELLQSQSTGSNILLGAQDCDAAPAGAHTGSVPASLLAEVGCSLVELGHAERRAPPHNETNAVVAEKVKAVLGQGLIPLVCIGEREQGKGVASEAVGRAISEVSEQVVTVLNAANKGTTSLAKQIYFAYEPVWAIGADRPASPDHVCAVVDGIRQILTKHDHVQHIEFRILYGGSAGPGTWNALKDHLDGLFLGRFAHDIENVKLVVKEVLHSRE